MQRRRGTWLVVAMVLFGLGAVLMLSGQGEEEAPPPPKVEFPRRMRFEERQRMEARRTYVMPEDVYSLFHDVLRHRIVLSYEALAADVRPDQVLDASVDAIPQPDVELGSGRSHG